MARKSSRQGGRFQSSIVARLNIKLFFRLLGIYLMLDLLLVLLFCGGLVAWAEGQAGLLSQQAGVPGGEARGAGVDDGGYPAHFSSSSRMVYPTPRTVWMSLK